ncbi:hypothetical protein HG263_19220, partial [Pseudoalteromonas sp. JBTF-M23]
LSRVDNLIKIRGFRVEPEEISTVIKQVSAEVEQAVVIDVEHNGTTLLVAYLVAVQGKTLAGAELKQALSACLPGYMVPTMFITLEQIPLSLNGKIDRKALLALYQGQQKAAFRAGNAIEEQLHQLWTRLLSSDHFGAEDSFYAAGGNSLQLVSMRRMLQDTFAVDISLGDLFAHTTIAELAELIQRRPKLTVKPQGDSADKVVEYRMPRELQVKYKNLTKALNIPVIKEITVQLPTQLLCQVIGEQLSRVEALNLSFKQNDDGDLILTQLYDSFADVEVYQCAAQAELQGYLEQKTTEKFDLIGGSRPGSATIVEYNGKRLLVLVFDHILSDGYSIGLLEKQIDAALAQAANHEEVAESEVPTSYLSYLRDHENWLASDDADNKRAFWTRYLKDASSLALPGLPHFSMIQAQSFAIGEFDKRYIKPVVSGLNISYYTYLFASCCYALHKYFDSDKFLLGTIAARRGLMGSETTFGSLTGFIPVKSEMTASDMPAEFLDRFAGSLMQALENQDLPLSEFDVLPLSVNFIYEDLGEDRKTLAPYRIPGLSIFAPRDRLTFVVKEEVAGFSFFIEHDATIFDEQQLNSLVSYLKEFAGQTMDAGVLL